MVWSDKIITITIDSMWLHNTWWPGGPGIAALCLQAGKQHMEQEQEQAQAVVGDALGSPT